MSSQNFTRWAVIASGEGGGRIASQFFTRRSNPGIDERIVVMNTNRTDIGNTIQRLEEAFGDSEFGEQVIIFGEDQGAGNVFTNGERFARDDTDHILREIAANIGEGSHHGAPDAFMHVTTLGGGTGNGSIPYIVRELQEGIDPDTYEGWMNDVTHFVTGTWPYEDDPIQQQFNAVCGLSRLLLKPDGTPNADMVLLGANSHIEQIGNGDDSSKSRNDLVNERLIEAFDLLISGGRETRGVIDVQDLVNLPPQIGAYHFTPAIATGLNANVHKLKGMFDVAARNTFVPMDVSTTKAAYAIVRAPRSLVGDEITETEVGKTFDEWKRDNGINGPGMSTVSIKDDGRNEVDVLLLLGGFSLKKLLDRSLEDYREHRENLERGRRLGNEAISEDKLGKIEENLDRYLEITENLDRYLESTEE